MFINNQSMLKEFENFDAYSESPCYHCEFRTAEPTTLLGGKRVHVYCPREICP